MAHQEEGRCEFVSFISFLFLLVAGDSMEEVMFSAKYGKWISIKKMTIDASTKPEEIAAMLSGVSRTIDKKSYELLGIDTNRIDAYVSEVAAGKRKGFGSISEIFANLKPSEVKAELLASISPEIAVPKDKAGQPISHEKKLPFAEQYFVKSLLSIVGYDSAPDLKVLQKLYPQIKIPKPRGRMPKK